MNSMDEQVVLENSNDIEVSNVQNSSHKCFIRLEGKESGYASLDSTNSSYICMNNSPSEICNVQEHNKVLISSNHCKGVEDDLLHTPISKQNNSATNSKSASSNLFITNRVVSSTPLIISNNENFYKTPEGRKTLFCCGYDDIKLSPESTLSSGSKFIPISSPTSSEFDKLNDSTFFNDTLISCHVSDFYNTSFTNDSNINDEEKCDKSLCDNYKNSINVNALNESNTFCDERTLVCNENDVNIKIKSFDLLPGIEPLNDNDN